MKAYRRRNAAYKELPSGKRTDEKVSYRRLLFVNISRFRLMPSIQAILLPPRQFVLPGHAALSATRRPLCRKRRQIFAGFLISPVPGGLYSVLFPAKRREFYDPDGCFSASEPVWVQVSMQRGAALSLYQG